MNTHDEFLACHKFLLEKFIKEANHRAERGDWIDWLQRERLTLAVAANEWIESHGLSVKWMNVATVERLEGPAVGHVDYAHKLCLYVAERLYYPQTEDIIIQTFTPLEIEMMQLIIDANDNLPMWRVLDVREALQKFQIEHPELEVAATVADDLTGAK